MYIVINSHDDLGTEITHTMFFLPEEVAEGVGHKAPHLKQVDKGDGKQAKGSPGATDLHLEDTTPQSEGLTHIHTAPHT